MNFVAFTLHCEFQVKLFFFFSKIVHCINSSKLNCMQCRNMLCEVYSVSLEFLLQKTDSSLLINITIALPQFFRICSCDLLVC